MIIGSKEPVPTVSEGARQKETAEKAASGKTEGKTDTAEAGVTETAVAVDTATDDEDTPPWEEGNAPAAITVDDLLKVAAQKITTNRKNSPKIKALLASYGCGAVSELPEGKREAFLNDLAQL